MTNFEAELKDKMSRMIGVRKRQEREGLFPKLLSEEQQVETIALSASSIERVGATKASTVVRDKEALEATVIPFPRASIVPKDCWSMTPDIIRSALFGVSKRGKKREFLRNQRILAVDGVEVEFTGERLDQADMDVFMHALSLSRETGLGSKVHISFYDFLKSLGRSKGKANRDWLKESFNRLWTCRFKIKTSRYILAGGLIDTFAVDEITGQYYLRFNPEISKALKFQTFIPHKDRLKLGRSEISKWLHSYILSQSTNKNPHVIWSKNLQDLTSSKSCMKKFNQNIKKAFQVLDRELPNLLESWSVISGRVQFKKKAYVANDE